MTSLYTSSTGLTPLLLHDVKWDSRKLSILDQQFIVIVLMIMWIWSFQEDICSRKLFRFYICVRSPAIDVRLCISPIFHVIFNTSVSFPLNTMRALCVIPSFIEISTWSDLILLIVWRYFYFLSFFHEKNSGNAFAHSFKNKIIINACHLLYWQFQT